MAKHYENPKQIILESAKHIAINEGIASINIRKVAKKSDISIGTVYNYFPTKADLLVAVIENFWADIFSEIDFSKLSNMNFLDSLEKIYNELYSYLSKFEEDWLEQLSILSVQEKLLSKKKEKEYFFIVKSIILSLMIKDENIKPTLISTEKEKELFSEFIFDNIILLLKKQNSDFKFFKNLLIKLCYE